MRRGLVRLAAVMLVLAAVPAGADTVDDFTAAVPGIPGKSWADLLRQAFPTIAPSPGNAATVHGEIALRPIEERLAFSGECPDPLELRSIEFSDTSLSGKRRLLVGVTTDGDACVAPLALFDGDGKLLDAADVKQDRNYAFGHDFVRSLGPDGALILVTNFHINAGEGYDTETLVLATADRLTSIGSVFARSEQDCRRQISQEATIGIAPDYGPFARITGYIKTATQRLAPDCQTPQGKETVVITRTDWRWNAARRAYAKVAR